MKDWISVDIGGAAWSVRRDDPDAASPLFLQRVLDGAGDVLKEVRIKRLLRIRAGNRSYLVKHYRGRSFLDSLKNFWRGSPAFEECELVTKAVEHGIPTIPPTLFGERGQDSWVAFVEYPDLIPVDKYLRHRRNDIPSTGEPRKRVIRAYGRFARRIHDAGLDQDDFDPNNVLFRVSPDGNLTFFIVDFERAFLGPPLALPRRIWLLAKMNRFDGASLTDRMRFLAGYAEGSPPMDRNGLAEAILDEQRRVTLRDLARGARNATEESRNIGRMDTGYFRKKIGRETGDGLNEDQARDLARAAANVYGTPLGKGPGGVRIARVTPGEENAIWRASNACLRAGLPVLPPLAFGPGWVAFAPIGRDLADALGSHRGRLEWRSILESVGRSLGHFERLGLDVPGPWPPDPLTVFIHERRALFTCLGPLGEATGTRRPGVEGRLAAFAEPLARRFDLTRADQGRFLRGFRRTGGNTSFMRKS